MVRKLLPGAALVLVGYAMAGEFSLVGPTLPETPLELAGWGVVLAGVAAMRGAAALEE